MTHDPVLDNEVPDDRGAAQLLLPPPPSPRAALETEPWPDGAVDPSEVNTSDVQDWLREFHRSALTVFDEQLKRALIRQGVAPDALAGPELSVSLDDISIVDWIQALQLFAKYAVVTVLHDDTESRLWCAKGALIDAESGPLRGEAAVYRIVGLEKGQVVTELRRVHRARKIRGSTQGLLLEAARRKDESALLRGRIGSMGRQFRAREIDPRQRSLNTDQTAVLRAFDGPRRLSEVVEQSELGDVETLMALESLIRSGHLVEVPEAEEVPRPVRAPGSSPGLEKAERPVASVAPFSFWPQERNPGRDGLRWVASTLVMGLLVAGAAWIGAMDARSRSATDTPAAGAATPEPPRPPGTYPIAVRSFPANATFELDGRAIAVGSWSTRLPRDGMLHELRIAADGFVPARFLFVDTAPPLDVRLDPLPPALAAPSAVAGAPAAAPEDVEQQEAAPAPPSAGARRKFSSRKPQASRGAPAAPSEDAARTSAQKRKPYVQLIDAETPNAR